MQLRRRLFVTILVAVQIASVPSVASSQGYTPAEAAAVKAKHDKAKQDFRTFSGVDASRYDTGQQVTRRLDMCQGLKSEILGAHSSRELDTSDPTAGLFGSAQHAAAALNSFSDLGKLLRDQGPPKDLAADGNYYAKITEPDEAKLRQAILASPGKLQPADVMRLALQAANGNYVLATLTAHNLLKNTAYIGRADSKQGELYDAQGDNVVGIASKLTNLRGDPSAGDLMGPWYHIFGVLFIGSITNRVMSTSMTAAEQFSRYLLHEKLGIKSYSGIDREKADWDRCAVSTMAAIHPILYGETLGNWNGQWVSGDCEATVTQTGTKLKMTGVCHYGSEPLANHNNKDTTTCTIAANTATCTFVDNYHDADKDMLNRHGPSKMVLSGDTITYDATEVGETPVWRSPKYDSAMHPGATFHGVWTRKK